jgi:hypothetical protein
MHAEPRLLRPGDDADDSLAPHHLAHDLQLGRANGRPHTAPVAGLRLLALNEHDEVAVADVSDPTRHEARTRPRGPSFEPPA